MCRPDDYIHEGEPMTVKDEAVQDMAESFRLAMAEHERSDHGAESTSDDIPLDCAVAVSQRMLDAFEDRGYVIVPLSRHMTGSELVTQFDSLVYLLGRRP